MKRLHNFMDKMQEKPVEERRKMLLSSMIFSGIIIAAFGLWNISNNLVALNQNPVPAASEEQNSPSMLASLQNNVASIWVSVQDGLKNLNDKLGNPQNGQ